MKDKLFRRALSLFFSNTGNHGSNIQLVQGNELFQDDHKIAGELYTFFKNAVSNLNINENTIQVTFRKLFVSINPICKYKKHFFIP